jgi:hypothetical protein
MLHNLLGKHVFRSKDTTEQLSFNLKVKVTAPLKQQVIQLRASDFN